MVRGHSVATVLIQAKFQIHHQNHVRDKELAILKIVHSMENPQAENLLLSPNRDDYSEAVINIFAPKATE